MLLKLPCSCCCMEIFLKKFIFYIIISQLSTTKNYFFQLSLTSWFPIQSQINCVPNPDTGSLSRHSLWPD